MKARLRHRGAWWRALTRTTQWVLLFVVALSVHSVITEIAQTSAPSNAAVRIVIYMAIATAALAATATLTTQSMGPIHNAHIPALSTATLQPASTTSAQNNNAFGGADIAPFSDMAANDF